MEQGTARLLRDHAWDHLVTWVFSLAEAWVPWDYRLLQRPDLWYTQVARPGLQLLREAQRDLILVRSHGVVLKVFVGRLDPETRPALW